MTDERSPYPQTGPAKVDPETLVLRARPGRVVRFRRGVIVGLAAAGSLALVGTAFLALRPTTVGLVASGEDRPAPTPKAASDTLAGAPRGYGDVPRLGPPLPGDLGRPILERQREMATEAPDAMPPTPASDPAQQAAEAERQRLLAQAVQARQAPVLMQLTRNGAADAGAAPASGAAVPGAASPSGEPAPVQAGQGRNLSFVGDRGDGEAVNPHRLQAPASPWQLSAGSVISVSLVTGLNSDLPGMVIAQVTANVYDS